MQMRKYEFKEGKGSMQRWIDVTSAEQDSYPETSSFASSDLCCADVCVVSIPSNDKDLGEYWYRGHRNDKWLRAEIGETMHPIWPNVRLARDSMGPKWQKLRRR